jgi:hypothetical protein
MAKHPVSAPPVTGEKPKGPPAPRTMTVFSEREKIHVQMTLEQAVRESIKFWNGPNWGVSVEWFNEPGSSGPVTATMKRCDYVPVLDKHGKFTPQGGTYNFQYEPKEQAV